MKTIELTITEEQFCRAIENQDQPGYCERCVLAQALHDAGYRAASVGLTKVFWTEDDEIKTRLLDDAYAIRELFDNENSALCIGKTVHFEVPDEIEAKKQTA